MAVKTEHKDNIKQTSLIFEEIIRKEKEFNEALPQADFLLRIQYLKEIFKGTLRELDLAIDTKKRFPTEIDLGSRATCIRRNVFFFFLFIEIVAEQLNNDQQLLSDLRNKKKVVQLLAEWMNQDAIIVALFARNELAHLRPFIQDAFIPTRYEFEETGEIEPTFINYSITRESWNYIETKAKKLNEPNRTVALTYLDKLLEVQSNPKDPNIIPCYSLLPLIKRTQELTDALFESLNHSFEAAYKNELNDREKILTEIQSLTKSLAELDPNSNQQ